MNQRYPGIALAAAGGTVATLAALLFAYQSGLIRATDNFKRGVIAATLGIAPVLHGRHGAPIVSCPDPGRLWLGIDWH